MTNFQTHSPIDGHVVYSDEYATDAHIDATLDRAVKAQKEWAATPIAQRSALIAKAVKVLSDLKQDLGLEITNQMGRPIAFSPGEIGGVQERADYMLAVAPEALAPVVPAPIDGFDRHIERVPLGVVAVLAPWNYPFLTSVNAIVPALVAGNTVILKHSEQTPLCAIRYSEAFAAAGVPNGVFQHLFLSHNQAAKLMGDKRTDFVCFTGSVDGGLAVQKAMVGRFSGSGLELGGKDPAYVRSDADLQEAITTLADGAYFNSGQCCCGIERIYVVRSLYDAFVEGMVSEARKLHLGDPRDPATTLGPMVKPAAADFVRKQISDAVTAGAKALLEPSHSLDKEGSSYLGPQVLVDVDHTMDVMREESFGPVVGVMPVDTDEEALTLMNDSKYGLTASLWTKNIDAARTIGRKIDTGTVFMNRCDYLDPALTWTGVKDTGRGATLSTLGLHQLTRPKSFHLKF
jgi:acyl-CoA reductase-like NAD-dependent aldehyde dehydrogenase